MRPESQPSPAAVGNLSASCRATTVESLLHSAKRYEAGEGGTTLGCELGNLDTHLGIIVNTLMLCVCVLCVCVTRLGMRFVVEDSALVFNWWELPLKAARLKSSLIRCTISSECH